MSDRRIGPLGWFCLLLGLYSGMDGGAAAPAPPSKGPATSVTLPLFFSGRRLGSLEPCGCQSGQTGGMQFERAIYQSAVGKPAAVRVDAGEWSSLAGELPALDAMKTTYVLRALGRLNFDAVNVGQTDIKFGESFFSNITAQYPRERPDLVSANLFLGSDPRRHAFPTFKIIRRGQAGGREVILGITGVLDKPGPGSPPPKNGSGAFVIGDPQEDLRQVIEEIGGKVDMLIVLHSGALEAGRELIRSFPRIDRLISTGQPQDRRNAADADGSDKICRIQGMNGETIGAVSLTISGMGKLESSDPTAWLPVTSKAPRDMEIETILAEFKRRTQEIEIGLPSGEVRQSYQGGEGCASCHQAEARQWEATAHAKAMLTLVNRGQQFNPECVGCHSTGYRKDNGFYSIKHVPSQAMRNVQCEACHGPARRHAETKLQIISGAGDRMQPDLYKALLQHAQNEIPPRQVSQKTCQGCHTPERDNAFDYERKIEKIRHLQKVK